MSPNFVVVVVVVVGGGGGAVFVDVIIVPICLKYM